MDTQISSSMKEQFPTTTIPLLGKIDTLSLWREYNLSQFEIQDCAIGNDYRIHLLLATRNKNEEEDSAVSLIESNAHYKAVTLLVDWQKGTVLCSFLTDFGVLRPSLAFIQSLGSGFLLLGMRAGRYPDGKVDHNALITDMKGDIIATYCLGDGIQECIVDAQNRIITGYFDEGVFGNLGWDEPLGASGLNVWSSNGELIWKNETHDICDCYYINLDCDNNLWFYYYTDFYLVKTDYKNYITFPEDDFSGGSCLFRPDKDLILIALSGYTNYGKFVIKEINEASSSMAVKSFAVFTWQGEPMRPLRFSFRGEKALLGDEHGYLYFTRWV